MCQLAGPGAISFPEAATLDDADGPGLTAGPRVRGLRSGCSASDKAALMPMIPQCGAEEPFDETLEAIDAALDAELEEQHHALPARHKKKVCCSPRRPLSPAGFVSRTTRQWFSSAGQCTLRTPMQFAMHTRRPQLSTPRRVPSLSVSGPNLRYLHARRSGVR